MNKTVPWSVKGVDFDARTAAKEAARRAGMTLGEWLNSVIAEQAAEQGVDPDDIGEDERVAAVRSRLERMSPAARPPAPGLRRRTDRTFARPAERDFDEDDTDYERPRPRRYREAPIPRDSYFEARAESLLDDAARSFERHARRESAETNAALESVARRLESIEGRLETPRSEPAPDRALKRVISRLESRIEALAAREDVPSAPEVARHFPAPGFPAGEPVASAVVHPHGRTDYAPPFVPPVQPPLVSAPAYAPPSHIQPQVVAAPQAAMRSSELARIEAKLNRLLEREQQQPLPFPSDAGTVAYAAYRPDFAAPAPRRSMQDAIAEINRRQADLDRAGPRTATSATNRFAARVQTPAQDFAAPVADVANPEAHSELRSTVATLKGEIAGLTKHLEALRREPRQPEPQLAPAPVVTPEFDGLKKEISTLARQIENLRQDSPKPDLTGIRDAIANHAHETPPELADMRRQLSDMSAAIGKLAPRDSLASLEKAVRKLGEQMSQPRYDGAREDQLAPVEQLVADLQRRISDFAPRAAVETIGREIETIRHTLESAAKSGVDQEAFSRVCAQTAEIRNLLAAAVARPVPIENIEKQISALAKRVDIIATRGMTPVGVSAVNESVGEIRSAMDEVASATLLTAIEERMEDLARKIEDIAARPSPAVAQLETITQRLDNLDKTLSAQAERQAKVAPSASGENIGEISERLASMQQTLAWQAERQPVAKVDTSLLEGMLQQIMEKVNRPAPASPAMPDLDGVEQSLKDIAARVEAIAVQPDNDGLAGLEERITSLALKLDRPEFSGPSVGDIEQTLNHLASQLEENRLSAIDAASNAARSAARDVLAEFASVANGAAPSLDAAREIIGREINSLRALQDASDRRTHATLGAVHETLEKVVDRLAMLEDEIGDRGSEEPAPRRELAATPEERLASGPAPVFSKPEPQRDAPAAGPFVSSAIDQRGGERRAAEPAQHAPPVQPPAPPAKQSASLPPAPAGLDADFLIEPGSGQRPARSGAPSFEGSRIAPAREAPADVPDETMAEPPAHGRAAASNFIAAARRAQQAAQAQAEIEAAQQLPPKKGIKALAPDNALAEARNRAKAAASILSGLKRGPKASADDALPDVAEPAVELAPKQPRRLFSSRKVLYSLAGLALVIGALTIVRQNLMRPTPPRPVAAAPATPAAPQPQASAPAQASPAQTGATVFGAPPTAIPAPAEPAQAQNPAAEPRTDRSPVSSIPTFAGGAPTASTASSANNLRVAVAAGDPRAQYELAIRMVEGRRENRDPAAAVELFEKAAQKGLAPAQYRLGSLYEKGVGVEKNLQQARHWYEQAASAGNVKAMHNFAVLLAEGADGKPDYATAANWFKKAAEHGVRDSQYNLAILYARGLGIEQSMVDAYVWLALAEAQGDTDAGGKRNDVAKRLSPGQLSEAQERVKRFRALRAQAAANEVTTPPGGWSAEPTSAQAPVQEPVAEQPAPAPQRQRAPATKRPKVSSL